MLAASVGSVWSIPSARPQFDPHQLWMHNSNMLSTQLQAWRHSHSRLLLWGPFMCRDLWRAPLHGLAAACGPPKNLLCSKKTTSGVHDVVGLLLCCMSFLETQTLYFMSPRKTDPWRAYKTWVPSQPGTNCLPSAHHHTEARKQLLLHWRWTLTYLVDAGKTGVHSHGPTVSSSKSLFGRFRVS